MVIWKYELKHEEIQDIEIPSGSRILCVQKQGLKPCIWVEVFIPENPKVKRTFEIIGTGNDFKIIDKRREYIGTWQDSFLVFHLYEHKKIGL